MDRGAENETLGTTLEAIAETGIRQADELSDQINKAWKGSKGKKPDGAAAKLTSEAIQRASRPH